MSLLKKLRYSVELHPDPAAGTRDPPQMHEAAQTQRGPSSQLQGDGQMP